MIATDVGGGKNLSQPWLKYLEDEIQDFEKGSVDEEATIIIRNILAANTTDEATEKEAALHLDKYAKNVHLRCDLMVRCSIRDGRYIHAKKVSGNYDSCCSPNFV